MICTNLIGPTTDALQTATYATRHLHPRQRSPLPRTRCPSARRLPVCPAGACRLARAAAASMRRVPTVRRSTHCTDHAYRPPSAAHCNPLPRTTAHHTRCPLPLPRTRCCPAGAPMLLLPPSYPGTGTPHSHRDSCSALRSRAVARTTATKPR